MRGSHGRWLRRLSYLALGALAGVAANFAHGQRDANPPALYEGADRTARLVAGAKREGSLSLYASMAEKDLIRLVSEFERRYGIKVKVWRSGKNNVLRRAVTEARAGRFEVTSCTIPRRKWSCCTANACCRKSARPTSAS